MKLSSVVFVVLVLCTLAVPSTAAGDTLRIATYNLLNYPGTDYTVRNPHFRAVLRTMDPDVLVAGEMTTQAGVNLILGLLNSATPGEYAAVPFNDGYDTDNALFYRPGVVRFEGANYISSGLRDIAEYNLTVLSTGELIRIYGVHLKAGSTASDQNQRTAEATILRERLNILPAGSKFLVLGDFNCSGSTEGAIVKLTETGIYPNGRVIDPLNAAGSWRTYSYRAIQTQSPRLRSFGGGTAGGMDDRFDLILTSSALLSENAIVSRYTAYGNDGRHYNDSINARLPNLAVPDSVANGLHYASDHLPVYCDFVFAPPPTIEVASTVAKGWNLVSLPVITTANQVAAVFPLANSNCYIYDTTGYYTASQLVRGTGYWLRFPDTATIIFQGEHLAVQPNYAGRGWNLVGSVSDTLSVENISTEPAGLIESHFYGYEGGYEHATIILPGKGYWVKLSGAGTILLKK